MQLEQSGLVRCDVRGRGCPDPLPRRRPDQRAQAGVADDADEELFAEAEGTRREADIAGERDALILIRYQDETNCGRVHGWQDHDGLIRSS